MQFCCMQYQVNSGVIRTWAEEDRPREKFLNKGKHTLSDAELMAILIGSGTKDESAVDLCKKIMISAGNDLYNLGKFSIHDFKQFKGIGLAKAIAICSALELGRRRRLTEPTKRQVITCSADAYELMRAKLVDLEHEEFHVVYLNRANMVVKQEALSKGGTRGTVVDIKLLMRTALNCLASSILLYHNHPSRNPNPSQEDIAITKKIIEASKYFDISVADHIIVYDGGYTSFADEGLI
jgi:DNA repair protein RadC